MATSGSDNFSVSRDDIINLAAEDLGMKGTGFVLSNEDNSKFAIRLNAIVKQWMGKDDFAPGLKMWSRQHGYIFLQKNQSVYQLGPGSGDDNAAKESYVTTTLSAAAASGAGTLTVNSITGISDGDYVGVVLDSGSVYWDVVNGAPSGSTVTLTSTTSGAAASGNRVFAYTNKVRMPLHIISACIRDVTVSPIQDDPPMVRLLTEEYESLGSKYDTSRPVAFLYEPQLSNGNFTIDCYPDDVNMIARILYLRPIEDFDAATDTPDYPQKYYRALAAQLALDAAPAFGKSDTNLINLIKGKLSSAMAIAKHQDPETTTMYFQPDAE